MIDPDDLEFKKMWDDFMAELDRERKEREEAARKRTKGPFRKEGWIRLFEFPDEDHYVMPGGTPHGNWGALCGAFGWFKGPGLREKPWEPVCKTCLKRLKEIGEQNDESTHKLVKRIREHHCPA